jgi:hypothetical protein
MKKKVASAQNAENSGAVKTHTCGGCQSADECPQAHSVHRKLRMALTGQVPVQSNRLSASITDDDVMCTDAKVGI